MHPLVVVDCTEPFPAGTVTIPLPIARLATAASAVFAFATFTVAFLLVLLLLLVLQLIINVSDGRVHAVMANKAIPGDQATFFLPPERVRLRPIRKLQADGRE